MYDMIADSARTTMCFCTGACRQLGGHCPSSNWWVYEPSTAPYTEPWPGTWPNPIVPNPIVPDVPMPIGPTGWVCPVCGRGNAPGTQTCPCIPIPMVIT